MPPSPDTQPRSPSLKEVSFCINVPFNKGMYVTDLVHVCLAAGEDAFAGTSERAAEHSCLLAYVPVGEPWTITVVDRKYCGAGGKENCAEQQWRFRFETLKKLQSPWPDLKHPADLMHDKKLQSFPAILPNLSPKGSTPSERSKFYKDRKRCNVHFASKKQSIKVTLKSVDAGCPKRVVDWLKNMFALAGFPPTVREKTAVARMLQMPA